MSDRTVIVPEADLSDIDFNAIDLVEQLKENHIDRIHSALDREMISFLKEHKLYKDGLTAEQNRNRLIDLGYEVILERKPDDVYQYKLCRVIDYRGIKVISNVSIKDD
jgi:hypothetical protein